jgi:two-component system response regulator AtoC
MSGSKDFSEHCLLLVEDDEIMRMSLEDRLKLEGICVRAVGDVTSARNELQKGNIDLVVTDIRLPDGTGIDLYADMSRHFPGVPVIFMTAYGDISDAVSLIKSGAIDYLTKPFSMDEFIDKIKRHLTRIADTSLTLSNTGSGDNRFKPGTGRLGKSPAMRNIERLVARISESDSSILITGESGVGKEVVATLIHNNSLRSRNTMVKVNCAALPSSLIESELFGHEKGAFTGAMQQRIGRFEQAQKGTIFLDEVAEVSPDIQVKLLRVLQEREIERVGGVDSIPLDIRVIAATQVVLEEAIEKNEFRSDLYWRLNVINIDIPPLRERREDILYLSNLFIKELNKTTGSSIKGLSKDAELQLLSMPFSGNVRELKNIIERAIILCDGPWIGASDLPTLGNNIYDSSKMTLRQSIEDAERKAIREALAKNSGLINQTSDSLGISRKSLWEKMKRYGIEK